MFDIYGNFYPDWPGQPDPRYVNQAAAAGKRWNNPAQQTSSMSPPIKHADIIIVPSIEHAVKTPVAAGDAQAFMTSDEKTFMVKEVHPSADGYDFRIYDLRPPAPPEQQFLTVEQATRIIDERLRAILLPQDTAAAKPAAASQPQPQEAQA